MKTKQQKRTAPELAGGFRDYGPGEMITKQKIIDTVRRTFESFGFDPLETAAVQKTQVLTNGEEGSRKIIFNVKGSEEKKSATSLRFDLTVPLARFLAANPEIPKPFKRYEIGRSWRGERQQAGRYREFLQADVDIVGTFSLNADAEIVAVMSEALKNLGVDDFLIKINNREILNDLPRQAGFPEKKIWEALRIVDKRDKIGLGEVRRELAKAFSRPIAAKIEKFFAEAPSSDTLPGVRKTKEILGLAESMGASRQNLEFDPWTVRGLSYYTGPVFETVLTEVPEIGSIFSGGRYDNLIYSFTGQKIPAVGTSLGVDRLFTGLEKRGQIKKQATTTKVIILNLDPTLQSDYFRFARILRAAGLNTTLYLGEDRAFEAQLGYALKKEVPYVLIFGKNENAKGVVAIKNLQTREQREIPKDKIPEYFKK